MVSNMKIIKIVSQGKAEVTTAPLPELRPDYVLVKIEAVALNPTDWKHMDRMPAPGATVGCDYAGTVIKVGSAVTLPWKAGDRICGFAHGSNAVQLEDGAFGEYAVVKGDVQMRIPAFMSFEDAATLGVGVTTCGQGLYKSLGLALPNESDGKGENDWVLIYGGSSAMGLMAVQYAKLSGLKVVATCSSRNFDIVKAAGADEVFDYNSPTCGSDIRKLTDNKLYYAFDCISEQASPQICCDALSTDVGRRKPAYSALQVVQDFPRKNVEHKLTIAYTIFSEAFRMGPREFSADPSELPFGSKFVKITQKLLDEGKLKGPKAEMRKGGLNGVLEGLDDLRQGKVSARKLVYKVSETA